MTDLSALGLKIESEGVVVAITRLEKFATAANDASAASDKLGARSKAGGDGAAALGSSSNSAAGDVSKFAQQMAATIDKIDRLIAVQQQAATATSGIINALREEAAATRQAEASAAALAAAKIKEAQEQIAATRAAQQSKAAMATLAAQAERSAAGLTSLGSGSKLAAYHVQNLAFQLNDVFVGLASGQKPLTVFVQQGAQIGQVMQQAGLGVKSFAAELLFMTGLVKRSGDAALDAAAGEAVAVKSALTSTIQQAAAAGTTAKVQRSLAEALVATAATAEETAVAEALLTSANTALAASAAEAATAERALAVASGKATEASGAAAAASKVRIGVVGEGLIAAAAAAAVAFAGFKKFQDQVAKSGELDNYAKSLGLTKKEFKELQQQVGGLSDNEMKNLQNRLDAFKISAADVFEGLVKTVSDDFPQIGSVWQTIMSTMENYAFQVGKNIIQTFADLYGGALGAFNSIKIIWQALPAIFKEIFVAVYNYGAEQFERLANSGIAAANAIGGALAAMSGNRFTPFDPVTIERAKQDGDAIGDVYVKVTKAQADAVKQGKALGAQFIADLQKNTIAANKARQDAAAAAIIADRTDKKPKTDKHAEELAREAAATESLIKDNYGLVDAYKQSTAAGQKQEIVAKATADAIKKQADVASYVARQLRLYVSQQAADGAKNAAALNDQAMAQEFVNKAVADGALSAEDASEALKNITQQRKLMAIAAIAWANQDVKGYNAAKDALQQLTAAQERDIAARKQAEDQIAKAATNRNIDALKLETELQKQLGDARLDALRGLSGDTLENELARISVEYEKQNVLLQAQAAAAQASALGHKENAEKIRAEAQARVAQISQQADFADVERRLEQDRKRALDTAHEIADIIGGGVGRAVGALADALDKISPEITQSIGKLIGADFGSAMSAFGAAVEANKAIGKVVGFKGGPLGIFTGLFTSTPKASATVTAVAGEFMDAVVKGTKDKLKEVASGMADGVISGLQQIADTLGADLTGNANVSIGLRKDNYRVDPTGAGRTKGSGVVDFGKDQAAAIAFALQDAIKDGVLSGLSDSLTNLITGDGDLQAQLQKALSFKGVFDDLAQHDDPAAFAQAEITKWHDAEAKIFAEAGATADELAVLERLTGIKRADAAAAAAKDLADKESARRNLEIKIMELSGDSAGAAAAQRQLELDAMDASLRPLQERINALTDEATAAAHAAAVADEKASLQIRLADALGNSEEALRLRREQELAAVDPLNQALLKTIYTAEDAAAAQNKLADAQQNAISQISSIQGAAKSGGGILSYAGNPDIMAALSKYAGGDQDGGVLALNNVFSKLASSVVGANTNLFKPVFDQIVAGTQGNTNPAGIVGPQGVYSSNAALKDAGAQAGRDYLAQQFKAQADAKAQAEQDRVDKLADLHSRLADAYERERSALQDTIDKFTSLADAMKAARAELDPLLQTRGQAFAAAQVELMKQGGLAGAGNTDAMAKLPGLVKDFLPLAMSVSRTAVDYQRQVAFARNTLDMGIDGATDQIDINQAQLDALNRQIDGQLETKKQLDTVADLLAQILDETASQRNEQLQLGLSTARNTRKTAKILDQTSLGGTQLQVDQTY